MGRDNYKSEKRRKEIARIKKREEKRQKKLSKGHTPEGGEEGAVSSEEGEVSSEENTEESPNPTAQD